MTKRQIDKFLAGPNIARVATVKKNGAPFVVPVWYEWDGKDGHIVGRESSSWMENIKMQPRVKIDRHGRVADQQGRHRGRGGDRRRSAEDWVEIGKKMVKKYVGPDAGDVLPAGVLDQPRVSDEGNAAKDYHVDGILTRSLAGEEAPPRLAPRYYAPGSRFDKAYAAEKKHGP